MIRSIKNFIRPILAHHSEGNTPPILLAGIPRGGSTWIMEVLGALDGVRTISEPFNIRVPRIAAELQISCWKQLFEPESLPRFQHYLGRIQRNELRFLNPNPFVLRRFATNRSLYKIIHLPSHLTAELASAMEARFICLVRHPVPVALSRKVFPILEDFHASPYRDSFSSHQLNCADRLISKGSHLEKGVLAWSLHFEPFLRQTNGNESGLTVSYEDCVAQTSRVLIEVENYLGEKFPADTHHKALNPSRVLSKSDATTQAVLSQRQASQERNEYLIGRWKTAVSEAQCSAVQEILEVFEIKLYHSEHIYPVKNNG